MVAYYKGEFIMQTITGKYTTALVTIDDVEEQAIDQIRKMCSHPACTEPIVVMPDTHLGLGCVIGFTMPIGDKIVPNFIGVDIACSMQSVRFDIDADDIFEDDKSKAKFNRSIRQAIPMGFNVHKETHRNLKGGNFYKELNENLRKFHMKYVNRYGDDKADTLKYIEDLMAFETHVDKFGGNKGRILSALGTLGGGNHFIEASKDETGALWITTHSGSRNFGKQVCDFHQNKAWKTVQDRKIRGKQEYIASLKEQIKRGEFSQSDMPEALTTYDRTYQVGGITKIDAFLEGKDMYEYLYDMVICQTWARWSHDSMFEEIYKILVDVEPLEIVFTSHNYINFGDFVIRKGAIASYKDQKMVIPFNAVDGILICEGKSNPDWNFSACHGAGRVMSRSQAKKTITPEQAKEVMGDVYASETPVDESKLCYKDATMIEKAIAPTAKILYRLKPIVNFKAKD